MGGFLADNILAAEKDRFYFVVRRGREVPEVRQKSCLSSTLGQNAKLPRHGQPGQSQTAAKRLAAAMTKATLE